MSKFVGECGCKIGRQQYSDFSTRDPVEKILILHATLLQTGLLLIVGVCSC